jgi:hypothetical protein
MYLVYTSVLLLCVVSLLATSLSSLYVPSVDVSPALRFKFVVCRWYSALRLSGSPIWVAPRYWVDRSLRFHVQIKVPGRGLRTHGVGQSHAFHLRGACVSRSLSNCLITRE